MSDAFDWTEAPFGGLHDLVTGQALSPAALRGAVGARADALAASGLVPGALLAVARKDAAASLVDLLAGWRVGAAVAMLDAGLTAPEMGTVLAHARPALIATDDALTGGDDPRHWPGPARDRPALLLFTSGTTGTPKAVVLTMRALEARVALNLAAIGARAVARTVQTLPLHFGHGLIGSALTTLAAGGTLILPERGGLALTRGLGSLIDDHRVTFLTSVPTLWRAALRMAARPQGGSLARVHVGSAPLSAALWGQIADWADPAPVWNCYGITETANWIGGAPWPGAGAAIDAHVGQPWGGAYAVRGPDGPMDGGTGEILYRGPAVMQGYLDRPEQTDAVLSRGWYATGDSGTLSDGVLTLAGRRGDEINRAGIKVQPAEIDRVIEAHPDIAEACAFAAPDAVAGETVAAAFVARPDTQPQQADLAAFCAERLRPHAIPERWFAVDAIPRTPRGKISRAAVAKALL